MMDSEYLPLIFSEIRDIKERLEKCEIKQIQPLRDVKHETKGYDPDTGETLVDTEVICKMYKISKDTVKKYRQRGKIPYLKLGGKVLYNLSDVKKHLNQHYIGIK